MQTLVDILNGVQESLMDDDDKIMADAEEATIRNWMEDHTDSATYKIDPKTKKISAGYLDVAGPIPSYIKFGSVRSLYITIIDAPEVCELELPENSKHISITANPKKLILKNLNVEDLSINSTCEEIVFPKKFKVDTLGLRECDQLVNIENFNASNISSMKLSPKFCGALIRQKLKLSSQSELFVFGNRLI